MFTSTANALARVVATSAESRGVSALKAVQAPGRTRCISNSSASSALPRTAHGISGRPQTAELILSPPFFAQAHAHSRFYATKSRKGKRRNDDEDEDDASNDPNDGYDDDVPVLNTRGKGATGAKSKTGGSKSKHPNREHDAADSGDGIATTTRNQELPGEKFDIAQLAENMARAVKRCRETVSGMVGMMGRPDPAVLDSVRVPMPTGNEGGKGEPIEKASVPLLELATVGVRDGALWVTCYDPDSVKLVERGIYLAELGLTPQVIQNEDEAMIKIPIPRPTAETRAKLLKDLARICENARVSIRAARHQGQKDLASDQKRKIVGSEEARKEAKKLDEETKQHTAAVDKVLEELKNKVERAS